MLLKKDFECSNSYYYSWKYALDAQLEKDHLPASLSSVKVRHARAAVNSSFTTRLNSLSHDLLDFLHFVHR